MPKTIASGVGLTNARLAEQGLISMKLSGPNLLPFVEPPSACPHARLCGEDASNGASLPDYLLSTDRTDIPLKRANDDLRGAQLLSPPP